MSTPRQSYADPQWIDVDTAATFLRTCPDDAFMCLLRDCIERIETASEKLVSQVLIELEKRQLLEDPLWQQWQQEQDVRRSPFGLRLLAETCQRCGKNELATDFWTQLASLSIDDLATAHLALARLSEHPEEAYRHLRAAVGNCEEYAFLSRAARMLHRLQKKSPPPDARTIKVAVLGSSTTSLLLPILQVLGLRSGLNIDCYEAPFGQIPQEILNPGSGLYAFAPDFVIIATNWRDAGLPPISEDPETALDAVVEHWKNLWGPLMEKHPCTILQHNFDVPVVDSAGSLSGRHPGGRARLLRRLNEQLLGSAPAGVLFVDFDHIAGEFGKRAWFDAVGWYGAKQYPAADALPLLCEHYLALIRTALGLSAKVLALDLDNTLWQGVIGEDGLQGIKTGPPSAVGEAFADIRRYAAELKERGILLVVVSKNNEADAKLPFEQGEDMILKLEDFASFRANWEDKTHNLRQAAEELNLGLDSFVLLDDNPAERAQVRTQATAVAVVELPPRPEDFLQALQAGHHFEALTLSTEDQQRHADYQANRERQSLQTATGSLTDYLRQLRMEATLRPFNDADLDRIVQLINKTNQFNLTTRRYSREEVKALMASPDYWTCSVRLSDRFGDSGLVGVIIARREPARWYIDTWLMSCRVLGRGVEALMLHTLAQAARDDGATELEGRFIPTAKNGLVADLFPKLGFAPAGTDVDAQKFFAALDALVIPETHIEVVGS